MQGPEHANVEGPMAGDAVRVEAGGGGQDELGRPVAARPPGRSDAVGLVDEVVVARAKVFGWYWKPTCPMIFAKSPSSARPTIGGRNSW